MYSDFRWVTTEDERWNISEEYRWVPYYTGDGLILSLTGVQFLFAAQERSFMFTPDLDFKMFEADERQLMFTAQSKLFGGNANVR